MQNNIKFREEYKSKMEGISKLSESISKNQDRTRELNDQITSRSKSNKILKVSLGSRCNKAIWGHLNKNFKEKIASKEAELANYEQSIDAVREKIKIKVAEVQDQNSRLQVKYLHKKIEFRGFSRFQNENCS